MASNASDDDKGNKTQFGVAPPPQVKRPSQPDAPAPPPLPPSSGERTSGDFPPPPKMPRREPPQDMSRPEDADDAEEEGTIIEPSKRKSTAKLQRLQPPGHSEIVYLDRTSYVVGRSHKCDVELYSQTASREHARLTFRDAAWYIQPIADKTVLADGVKVRGEQCLAQRTRLRLGGDELLFIDENAATAPVTPTPIAPGSTGRLFGILVAVFLVVLAVAAWWLLAGG